MKTNKRSSLRWPLLLGYLVIVSLMLACMGIAVGSSTVEQGLLQLNDGNVEIKDENGDWVPMAGTSSFDLVGALENTDPWTVAGKTFETNESTQIEEGLEVGDLVRVRGMVQEEDKWLAYSIESAKEQTNNTIILIGKVTSVDPWVVNGITLSVTDTTVINGEITTGMLVRAEILLLEDGTWEVVSISPLNDLPPTSGCATVVATVVSVTGNEVQFLGWPTTVTVEDKTQTDDKNNATDDNDSENNDDQGEDEDGENSVDITTLQPGQQVLVVVCASKDGQLVIVNISIIDNDDDNEGNGGDKVLVCHKPNKKKGGHTLSISSSAVPAHLGHGDTLGACP